MKRLEAWQLKKEGKKTAEEVEDEDDDDEDILDQMNRLRNKMVPSEEMMNLREPKDFITNKTKNELQK